LLSLNSIVHLGAIIIPLLFIDHLIVTILLSSIKTVNGLFNVIKNSGISKVQPHDTKYIDLFGTFFIVRAELVERPFLHFISSFSDIFTVND
jgi:hypothetical protein